jgi:hypothetical protein
MFRQLRFRLALGAVVVLAAGGASCTSDRLAAPQASDPSSLHGLFGGSVPSLITCPSEGSQSATALIDPLLGGVLAAGTTSVVIPAGAVLAPTAFTLTVPSSKYVEIEVTAQGSDHFVFQTPVTVTIDYGRCSRSDIDKGPLSVWNIDPVTKALLEPMVSVDDKLSRTIIFSTIHFSGYAVAD